MLSRIYGKRSSLILLAVFLVLASVCRGQGNFPDLAARGEQELRQGRTSYDIGILSKAHADFAACVRGDRSEIIDRCYYDLARADHYLNLAELDIKDTRSAKRWLNTALIDAQAATARDPGSADAHALLADIYGAEIDGMFSGMKYGPKANDETAKALRLDPHNAQAWSVLGRKYLYAPSLFGGDLDKAVDAFRNATAYDSGSDEDWVWLAVALQKKGDLSGARKALAEALRLNERSVFAHREMAALR